MDVCSSSEHFVFAVYPAEGREACHKCWKLEQKKGLTPLF